jgi:sarcosine oxidase
MAATERHYDVIVVGLGAMGSAAAYQLARRGQRVLGLDAFAAGHTLGSSHGETRIIRMAYIEHPNYVPLLRRAYQLWAQLETEARTKLLHQTGGLFVGPPEGSFVVGSLASAREHGLPHSLLEAGEIRHRFPMFQARSHEVGLYEEEAGVLLPERCIQAHLDLAQAAGAELHHAEPVTTWSERGVETEQGRYTADKLIVTVGAWAGKVLRDLGLPLQPERSPIFWFQARWDAAQFEIGRLPIWIWQDPGYGDFYGTPHLEWPGAKVGMHHTRQYVDPDTVDRKVSGADEQPVREFLERCVPDLAGSVADSRVCLYTNTPDEDFVVDRHPEFANVYYAAGFSGHGFKFAGVIGEVLADLATTGQATPDADFLRATRFSDPKTAVGGVR